MNFFEEWCKTYFKSDENTFIHIGMPIDKATNLFIVKGYIEDSLKNYSFDTILNNIESRRNHPYFEPKYSLSLNVDNWFVYKGADSDVDFTSDPIKISP